MIKKMCLLLVVLVGAFSFGCSDGGSSGVVSTPVEEPPQESFDVTSPVRIAMTPTGQLVVTEANDGRALFLDSTTLDVTGSIASSKRLTAVGATSDKIFLGLETAGAVGVYSYGGELLYSLGSGVGEFELPNDLVLDEANDRVYVVDTRAKRVKVYNLSDGNFLWSFGQNKMNFPTGIAFDQSSDTLLISDFGVGTEGCGSLCFDPDSFYAGIWRYGLDGGYVETLTGDFSRPQGLAVDDDGVIFLVDSLLGQILVYQKNPGAAGYTEIYRYGGSDILLQLPLDIVLDPANKNLYVTNNLAGTVEVFLAGGTLP